MGGARIEKVDALGVPPLKAEALAEAVAVAVALA